MISLSSSFPDLKAYNSPNAHRIPRKPPPAIDIAERYPTPDPQDPFAPLWVLRNRTSSALLGTRTPLPPYSGPYGSQETLNNLAERRRSNSYLLSSPSGTAFIHQPDMGDTDSFTFNTNTISPPGSPLKATTERPHAKPTPKALPKIGHYTPHSQMHQRGASMGPLGTLQAFPRISTPFQLQTDIDIDLASPGRLQRPWSPVPDHHHHHTSCTAHFRVADAEMKYHNSSSASDTETDDDDTREAYIRPSSSGLKSPILARPHTAQAYLEQFPRTKAANPVHHQRAQSVQGHAVMAQSPLKSGIQGRLSKFLLPRKVSFLQSRDGGASKPAPIPTPTHMPMEVTAAAAAAAGRRPSTAAGGSSRPVSKASISSPQAVMSTTLFWGSSGSSDTSRASRNNSYRGRGRGRVSTTPNPIITGTPVQKWADEVKNLTRTDDLTDHVKASDGQNERDFLVSSVMTKSLSLDSPQHGIVHQRRYSQKPSWIRKEMLEKQTNSDSEKKPTICINNDVHVYSRPHSRSVVHPLTITNVNDRSNSDDDHFVAGSEKKRRSLDIDGYRRTQKKDNASNSAKTRSTSFFHVLNMEPHGARRPSTTGGLQVTHNTNRDLHARTSAFLPLSPVHVQPSTVSTSSASVATMSMSISAPSFASNPSEDDKAYTSPRPAPRPPVAAPPAAAPAAGKTSFVTKKFKKSAAKVKEEKSLGTMMKNQSGSRSVVTVDRTATPTSNLGGCTLPPASSPGPKAAGTKPANGKDNLTTTDPYTYPTEWTLPTPPQITFAASLPLISEDGTNISFGSLFANTRTIVIFIRHFWCPLCQDYMSSLKSLVRPEMLAAWPKGTTPDEESLRARLVKFVVISNGAHGMIGKYRQIFKLPFKVYTDPELAVYRALGLGRDGDDCQHSHAHAHAHSVQRNHSFYHYQQERLQSKQNVSVSMNQSRAGGIGEVGDGDGDDVLGDGAKTARKSGGYVKHGLLGGVAMVVVRAIKVGMPVWERGGDVGQLGGEFIFGPGIKCTYAHRMQTTRGHAPIEDVLTAAGIDVSALSQRSSEDASSHAESIKEGSIVRPNSAIINDTVILPKGPLLSTLNNASSGQPRRRLSSLKNLRDTISLSRAASVASALSISLIHKNVNTVTGVTGNGDAAELGSEQLEKRQTRRFSMGIAGFGAGMMSREEEERWMETRQLSIERLKEKKNARRVQGVPRSRTVSLHSTAVDEVGIVPEPDSERASEVLSPLPTVVVHEPVHGCEEVENTLIPGPRHDEDDDDVEEESVEEEEVESETTESGDQAETEMDDRRTSRRTSRSSLQYMSSDDSDTASSWSRSTAPPPEGGSYVFLHDVVL